MKSEKQSYAVLIFNPFEKIAGLPALSFGTLFMLTGAMLAGFFNARFDGVLDLHFNTITNFTRPLTDQIIVLSSLVAVFYPLALMLGARPRLLDIAGTLALSRFPFAIVPMVNATGFMSALTEKLKTIDMSNPVLPVSGSEIAVLIILAMVSLALLGWMVTLYFNAYKISTNLKGHRLVISFIGGLIAAEALSVYLTRSCF